MEALGASGRVIVYLRQDLGIWLREELKAYNLQNLGIDIVEANIFIQQPADARRHEIATTILVDLGLGALLLLRAYIC